MMNLDTRTHLSRPERIHDNLTQFTFPRNPFLSIGQTGSQGGSTSFNPALFVASGQSPISAFEMLITNAFVYMSPLSVCGLYVNLSLEGGNASPIGMLSFQIVDAITGVPLPGVDTPVDLASLVSLKAATTFYELNTPLPALTPFAVRVSQTGVGGTGRYRMYMSVKTC